MSGKVPRWKIKLECNLENLDVHIKRKCNLDLFVLFLFPSLERFSLEPEQSQNKSGRVPLWKIRVRPPEPLVRIKMVFA